MRSYYIITYHFVYYCVIMATLYIKNMVCDRCKQTVKRILEDNNLQVQSVQLGEVIVDQIDAEIPKDRLEWKLRDVGFELIYDKDEQMVALTKAALLDLLKELEADNPQLKISVLLASKLGLSYQTISRTFSSTTGETVEKYFLKLKIERVKELLTYDELTLSEISWKLGYSSVQHVSTQFKSVTGMTVRQYKESDEMNRLELDRI
jgi:AraC family transcriptional regulator